MEFQLFSKIATFFVNLSQLMKKITICRDCFVFVYRVTLQSKFSIFLTR